jgi:hypothetical protein
MTDLELHIAKAVCYKARFFQNSNEGRFILQLGELVYSDPAYWLSEKQRAWLYAILHKYRRQLPTLHRAQCKDKACRAEMRNLEYARRTQLALF